jgi:hypothetical protein
MRLKVLFHDNCFDGASSAALFSRYYRQHVDPTAELEYCGLTHTNGDPFPADAFDGDQHVIVDFRYHQSEKLTWWFDHHVSAFQLPGDEAHFRADTSGRKFYDPKARSCTKYLAGILAERFGFDVSPYRDLIDWADLIDGAQFPDAKTAVELQAPALRLMTWIEANHDPALTVRLIDQLQTMALPEIVAQPYVAEPLEALLTHHQRALRVIESKAKEEQGVVFFDVADDQLETFNKFIAYYLYPSCRYTVGVTRTRTRAKVSVGSNPWARELRTHDIAKICERYGGGGHPVVGAVSLAPEELDRARRIAGEIVQELRAT